MMGCHPMGAADCITAIMSDAQQYNMHNMHIKTQPHKHIYIPIYKHTIKTREPKANITPPLGMSISLYAPNMKPKWRGHLSSAP